MKRKTGIWTVSEVNDFIKPNEKLSKTNSDQGVYRQMIEKVLSEHLDDLQSHGVENVKGHYFFEGTDVGHPLSYVNTHYGVATFLMNLFDVPKDVDKSEAIQILEDGINRRFDELFFADSGSPDYDVIMGLLQKSKNIGDKNEIEAKKYLEKYHGHLIDSIIIVSGTGGTLDKSGVDIVVNTKGGKTINYQVKPFQFYKISPDGYAVIYKVKGITPVNDLQNRWIFVNGDKALEVKSKNLKTGLYQNDVMFVPEEDIISKSPNLKAWVPKN
jgi:hypothetical protein